MSEYTGIHANTREPFKPTAVDTESPTKEKIEISAVYKPIEDRSQNTESQSYTLAAINQFAYLYIAFLDRADPSAASCSACI